MTTATATKHETWCTRHVGDDEPGEGFCTTTRTVGLGLEVELSTGSWHGTPEVYLYGHSSDDGLSLYDALVLAGTIGELVNLGRMA
jgi:hypothetical protein